MSAPRIAVYQYLGYNGGFAHERTLLWCYAAIGANDENRNLDGDGWNGHPDPVYAEHRARRWSQFTGWPVVNEGRNPDRDHTPRDALLEALRHSESKT